LVFWGTRSYCNVHVEVRHISITIRRSRPPDKQWDLFLMHFWRKIAFCILLRKLSSILNSIFAVLLHVISERSVVGELKIKDHNVSSRLFVKYIRANSNLQLIILELPDFRIILELPDFRRLVLGFALLTCRVCMTRAIARNMLKHNPLTTETFQVSRVIHFDRYDGLSFD